MGINATRALTCKYNAQLSCGRVQTPTLAMIARREQEIKEFVPKEYFGLTLKAAGIRWSWQDKKSGSYRTFDKERTEKLKKELRGKSPYRDLLWRRFPRSRTLPVFMTSRSFNGMRAAVSAIRPRRRLNIMQRLYENHKVLTYPRTDSRYIGKDVAETLKERLKACAVGPYRIARRELWP